MSPPLGRPQVALSIRPQPFDAARFISRTDVGPAIPVTPRRVYRPGRIDTGNSHPAFGMDGPMLVSYYREAERGNPEKQFDTFDDVIETDGHLRGLINGRVETVSGSTWVIAPGRDDKPSKIAADALGERLRNELGFREFIEHHLMAPHYGIAVTNLVWGYEDGTIAPIEFVNAPPRRFRAPDARRAHEIWLIIGDEGSRQIMELERGLWAISRYRHRNPWAAGLMRTATWWAMFKRLSVRDWQVFAAMFGLPLAIGYYEEGASEPSRLALEEAVRTIGQDGYAVLSAMTELVVKETARSGDSSTVYPQIARFADEQNAKLIAGATLTTGSEGAGSYGLGTVHAGREYRFAVADAKRIEEMFVRDIGVPFRDFNGFDRAAPPKLHIQISNATKERAEVLQVIGQVVDLDEGQIREEFSLRKPAEGTGIRFQPKTPAAPPGEGPT